MTLAVEVVSPERILFSGTARVVLCRTTEGDIAFLTGHAPFIGALGIGAVTIGHDGDGGQDLIAVHGGFVEVRDDKVTILSDVAELAGQIDVGRARDAEARAAALLKDERTEEAEEDLRRAQVRILVATGGDTTAH